MDYITVYTEIAVVTIAYAAVLFFNVRSDMGGDWEINIFRALLLCLIVAIMADVVTQAQYRGFLHLNPTLVAFLYGFYMFIFSGVLPFLWFCFVETRLGGQLLKNRTVIIISIIPLAIMSFMAFASMKTGWFYSVDEYGIYTRGKYWSLQIVVNYIYFLFTTVHAFIVARREPSSIQKKQYYILASFIIAPIIGGFFQLFIGNHPFVAPSISLSMLLVFINIQGSLIHNDSLTGLFNRQSAEGYIDRRLIDYYDKYMVMYAKDMTLDTSTFKKYEKIPQELGVVSLKRVFPVDTHVEIRTMEGDITVTVTDDLYLMVGLAGEIYPIAEKKLRSSYFSLGRPYSRTFEYAPTIKNVQSDEKKAVIDYAEAVIGIGSTRIYAKPLDRPIKLFTEWDDEKYYYGDVGDYITVREDDSHDIYIVSKTMFDRLYKECD